MMTEHDMNRLESVTSQEIQNVMEKTLDFKIRNNELSEKEKSMAIHLIFDERTKKQVAFEQKSFKNVKELKWDELSQQEIKKYFPHSSDVMTAFRYHGDYSNKFDMFNLMKEKAINMGAKWSENKVVEKVFVN